MAPLEAGLVQAAAAASAESAVDVHSYPLFHLPATPAAGKATSAPARSSLDGPAQKAGCPAMIYVCPLSKIEETVA